MRNSKSFSQEFYIAIIVKGAQSYLFNFLKKNFWRFWYHKKGHIFLIALCKFYSWKVFHLEDISKNLPGYGNHN